MLIAELILHVNAQMRRKSEMANEKVGTGWLHAKTSGISLNSELKNHPIYYRAIIVVGSGSSIQVFWDCYYLRTRAGCCRVAGCSGRVPQFLPSEMLK